MQISRHWRMNSQRYRLVEKGNHMTLNLNKESAEPTFHTFDPEMWQGRAEGGYQNLGWVTNQGLLGTIINLAEFRGNETVVDVASGTGAVPRAIAPYVEKVHAFDISGAMLDKAVNDPDRPLPENVTVTVADALSLPYADNSVDLVTARMVYHHLEDIPAALSEALRIVKPGGEVMVIEYVLPNDFALPFERRVFDIKEKGRHLWTGPELANTLYRATSERLALKEGETPQVALHYDLLSQYSVKDWLIKSGLSVEEQRDIFQLYAKVDQRTSETMNMTHLRDEQTGEIVDVLVDRPFAYVIITKPEVYDQNSAPTN